MKKQPPWLWPAAVVLLALVPFTWIAFSYRDLPQFRKYQDEGLLLIAGQSLRHSEGYRIASLPGKPFQTKYQPLYPMLLSLLWSIDSRFPENLRTISVIQWLIVVAFLLAGFPLYRSFGFSWWKSAAMVTFLATSPWLLYWALLPIPDIAFSLLVVATFYLLHRHRGHPHWWWMVGCVGAAACLMKVAGVLLVPAIWFGSWRRREWKRGLITTAPIVAAFLGWTLWSGLHRVPTQNSVLWYYTDYVGFHVKNGGLAALPQILQANLPAFIVAVGNTFLYNLADSLPGRFLSVLVLAAGVSGVRRIWHLRGELEYPVFGALLTLLLLAWNFSPNVRFLAPTLPLLAMGLCAEAEHIYALIQRAARSAKMPDRAAAYTIGAGLVAACVISLGLNVDFTLRGIAGRLRHDRTALARDRITYDWCKRTLPSSSVVLTTNDAFLYLYTGLSAVQPVPNSVAFYKGDQAGELENFTHIDDLADFFGITHIVITPEDFSDYEPAQHQLILQTLWNNPRLRKIYAANDSTVLVVERKRL